MNLLKRLNQLTAQLDHQHIHPQTNSKSTIHTTPPLPLRLSASLIIIKPLETITPDGFNYHTLLIQRNSSQRSFSSAYVFPGGNLDPEDRNHQSLIQISSDDQITTLNEAKLLQDSLKICAIRETFEEAGILLGLTHPINIFPDSNSLQSFRQKLTNQEIKFTNINHYLENIHPSHHPQEYNSNNNKNLFDLNRFCHVANILTPTVFTKRWDTHFYLTILPSSVDESDGGDCSTNKDRTKKSIYMATPDESETVSTVWMSPNEALERCAMDPANSSNYITLAPPQFYLLRDLTETKDYRKLTEWKARIVPPFTPELVKCNDINTSALVLPGDPLHSSSITSSLHQKTVNKPRHRIYVHNEKHDFANHQGKFFRPISVLRSGMIDILGSGWHDLV